jgi:hypothetical protein
MQSSVLISTPLLHCSNTPVDRGDLFTLMLLYFNSFELEATAD